MARTPLFQQLRRNVQLARASLITGESSADIVERAAAHRLEVRRQRRHERQRAAETQSLWTRRGFLGASAGAAGALVLGGCARAVPGALAAAGATEPVLVVGAGIAGLTAAYRLRQANVPVRLFEAQTRVGGRMYSLRDYFADGQVVELGGELFDTNHATIRSLAAELGVALDDVSAEPDGVAHETWVFGGARRSTPEIVDALRPLAARMAADLDRLGDDEVTWRTRGPAVALDRTNLAAYLDAADITGWIRSLIDVSHTAEFGLEIGQQSALNLITTLSPDPFLIFGDSDERFHAHEGNDLITQRLAARVGDAIETGAVLERIRETPGGRYTLTFRRDGGTVEATSSHVIVAIPLTMLRRVQLDARLPEQQRRAFAQMDYGTNAKLMIGFAERTWRERHNASGTTFTDLGCQITWETSRGQGGRAGVLTNFTGGRNGAQLGTGTAAEQAARTVGMLDTIFPGVAGARAGMRQVRFHWPTHEWTQGSYACYTTGQWTSFRGLLGQRAGGIHFVGEHASLRAQGFMEGGCETGDAAARAVLRDLRIASVPRRALLRRHALAG